MKTDKPECAHLGANVPALAERQLERNSASLNFNLRVTLKLANKALQITAGVSQIAIRLRLRILSHHTRLAREANHCPGFLRVSDSIYPNTPNRLTESVDGSLHSQ